MGQKLSRRIVPSLEKLMQKAETNQITESLKEIQIKKAMASQQNHPFTDPNALIGGFRRGTAPGQYSQIEEQQVKFLEYQQQQALKASNSSVGMDPNAKMPDDLIKFLNDMGPVTKKVDTDLTSKRIVDEIHKQNVDEEGYFVNEAKKLRETRRHRLHATRAEFYTADGMETTTISNRATSNTEEIDTSNELKLTQEDIKAILLNGNSRDMDENDLKLIRQYISLPEFMVEDDKYVLAVRKEDVQKFKLLGAKPL